MLEFLLCGCHTCVVYAYDEVPCGQQCLVSLADGWHGAVLGLQAVGACFQTKLCVFLLESQRSQYFKGHSPATYAFTLCDSHELHSSWSMNAIAFVPKGATIVLLKLNSLQRSSNADFVVSLSIILNKFNVVSN